MTIAIAVFFTWLLGGLVSCVLMGLTDHFGIENTTDREFATVFLPLFWFIILPGWLLFRGAYSAYSVFYGIGEKLRRGIRADQDDNNGPDNP